MKDSIKQELQKRYHKSHKFAMRKHQSQEKTEQRNKKIIGKHDVIKVKEREDSKTKKKKQGMK